MAALGGESLFLLSQEGGRYRRLLSAWPSGGLAAGYQDVTDASVGCGSPAAGVASLHAETPTRRPPRGDPLAETLTRRPPRGDPHAETPSRRPPRGDPHAETPTRRPPRGDPLAGTPSRGPPRGDPHAGTPTRGPPRGDPHAGTPSRGPPRGDPHAGTPTRGPPRGLYWNTLGGFLVAGGGSQDVSFAPAQPLVVFE